MSVGKLSIDNLVRPIITLLILATLLLGPFSLGVKASEPGGDGDWEKVSPDLRSLLSSNTRGAVNAVNVIVQMNMANPGSSAQSAGDKPERAAKSKIEKHGGVPSKSLGIVRGASGKINVDRLAALSRDPDVRYISQDVLLVPTGNPYGSDMVDFTKALNADVVWARGLFGAGVTVAVIDSGVKPQSHGVDSKRVVASVDLVTGSNKPTDPGGHGTHVAGIIAGQDSDWRGVAPKANIASIRVIDETGNARMSTVIRGIQWAVQNRNAYGIRVINLSLGAPATSSYVRDPLAAAVEIAWHAGLVVVTSAGNRGPASGTISTPGYDPYVVTVGAVDMNATVDRRDDIATWFSSRGPTIDGLAKPDVVAPGRKMLSSRVEGSYLDRLYPDRIVENYFRLSGTSQAAAAVSGVAALMLGANPVLAPDQVKRKLMASASAVSGADVNAVGAGYVDAAKATIRLPENFNQAARPADSFAISVFPLIKGKSLMVWKSLTYNGGVDSRGVPWLNVTWDNVSWDNTTWDNLAWDNVSWDNLAWDNLSWDNVTWDNAAWDNTTWDNTTWDTIGRID